MDAGTAAVIFGLIGLGIGLSSVVARRVSDRYFRPERTPAQPVLPDGVSAVLSVLRSAAVVIDDYDEVLLATATARAQGVVRGSRLARPELLELAAAVRRDQSIRSIDLELPRNGNALDLVNLSARVAPLSSRHVLVLVEDRTKEHRLDVVRRDFVANISHELKTPIGALTLLAEAVRDAADDPVAVARFAGRMQVEAERLSRLVLQIIELSRVQSDDLDSDSARVDVDALVETALDRSGVDAQAKQISLVRAGDYELTTRGSRQQLALALGNLVENAVAYSDEGTRVVVDVRTAMSNHAKDRPDLVEISVTDQGIGIAEAEQTRIFERFYRVDRARSRATGGTGLGLSIVNHIAAGHRGNVRLWSVPGQGSTFTMSLPLGDLPVPHDRLDSPPVSVSEPSPAESSVPESLQPESLQPESLQPESLQPESLHPESLQPESLHPDRPQHTAPAAQTPKETLA